MAIKLFLVIAFLSLVRSQCSESCPESYINDGICDIECNNRECYYDGEDCLSDCYCDLELLQNGICDEECNSLECFSDYGDCFNECEAAGCPLEWLQDEYCDFECYIAACNYDEGDCEGVDFDDEEYWYEDEDESWYEDEDESWYEDEDESWYEDEDESWFEDEDEYSGGYINDEQSQYYDENGRGNNHDYHRGDGDDDDGGMSKRKRAIIIAACIGIPVTVIVLVFLAIRCIRKRRRENESRARNLNLDVSASYDIEMASSGVQTPNAVIFPPEGKGSYNQIPPIQPVIAAGMAVYSPSAPFITNQSQGYSSGFTTLQMNGNKPGDISSSNPSNVAGN